MAIDLKSSVHLYVQVTNDLKSKIESGKLKVGDRLPPQSEIAEAYDVSLITIKKAFVDLNREGVIYSRVGKGTYISNRTTHVDFSKCRAVGFVLRDLDSPFFSRIVAGAEKRLSQEKFNCLLSSTAGKAEMEDSMIQHFLEIGVSGLIIASMSREYMASPAIRSLEAEKFPYAVVSYMVDEDISYVGTDHEEGAFLATQHLIKLGYKKIGYINGIHDEGSSLLGELRKKGFLLALRKYNVEYHPEYEYRFRLCSEWNDYQSGYDIGLQFIETSEKPEAVFAFDDLSALGFQKAIIDNGFKVPQDVAIVGFDDIRRGGSAPVPLTTIHQPTYEIGQIAVDMVIKKITGQPVNNRVILRPSLIVRESCGIKYRGYQNAESRIYAQEQQ